MALPTLVKTWQHNVNNAIVAQGSTAADNKAWLLAVKNAMIGFGTAPWTVFYSCNSVTAGTAGDGVDRWTTVANLVNAAGAHSWIVLKQTGIASNFQVCIDYNSAAAGANTGAIVVSQNAGFTGGSTTARPTATDETVLISAQWCALSSDLATRWSVMQSTDGQLTRMLLCAGGNPVAYWSFEVPANSTTGWTNPFIATIAVSSGNIAASSIAGIGSTITKMKSGSTLGNVSYMSEGTSSSLAITDGTIGSIANEISSEWAMYAISIYGSTVGIRGRHGSLQDIWFGSNAIATGDVYPASGNLFIQAGNLILPWNGGAFNLS